MKIFCVFRDHIDRLDFIVVDNKNWDDRDKDKDNLIDYIKYKIESFGCGPIIMICEVVDDSTIELIEAENDVDVPHILFELALELTNHNYY